MRIRVCPVVAPAGIAIEITTVPFEPALEFEVKNSDVSRVPSLSKSIQTPLY